MPDLRLLPTTSLVLHEQADQKRVARLEARLRADGYLKNPPIVAPIPGTDRYVVLDGANRTSAVANIGYPHILVQVVDYNSDRVQLFTWYHLITGRTPANFLQEIKQVPRLSVERAPLEAARQALAKGTILAYLSVPGEGGEESGGVYTLNEVPGNNYHAPLSSTALLNNMVDTYKSDPHVLIHRVNSDTLPELADYYDNVSGLIVFPTYKPETILELARSGTRVPTGITRHIIDRRALRVNVPTSLLAGAEPLEEKSAWWHDRMKRKLADNQIRLYQEATYLFDE
ncbi:MAG: ParB N-terminal domain-containing protein [Chloroflexota bacterium]|nr:ParB N-terminal domain-containing protein [Chloroflexota bacterium]